MNKDCFAFVEKNGHEGCKALKELYCKTIDADFIKENARLV